MYDIRELQALPVADERLWPRPGGFLCLACLPGGPHGEECWGRACPCRCRRVLGLEGPFARVGEPTAPRQLDDAFLDDVDPEVAEAAGQVEEVA